VGFPAVVSCRPVSELACFALALVATAIPSARADDDWFAATFVRHEPSREFWVGAEAFRDVLSLYAGATQAVFGNLRQDGLRLRVVSAYSRYRYTGLRYERLIDDATPVTFKGEARIIDLLAGYQWSYGSTTAKLFAGWAIAEHMISPFDVETTVQGRASGLKGALELWHNLGDRAWISADFSYARTYGAHSHRLRFGGRPTETISLGPELSWIGHQENRTTRIGVFLRFDDGINEISASAGASMPRGDMPGAYATVQWLRRF
jgi:hypothetical protein